jgi:hypothetical protein
MNGREEASLALLSNQTGEGIRSGYCAITDK